MNGLSKIVLSPFARRSAVALFAAALFISCSRVLLAQTPALFAVPHFNGSGATATLSSITGNLLRVRPARFVGSPPYATQFAGSQMGFQYYTGIFGQANANETGPFSQGVVGAVNATVPYPAVPAGARPLGNSLVATLTTPQGPVGWTVKWVYSTVNWSGKTKANIPPPVSFDPQGAPGFQLATEDWDLTGLLPAVQDQSVLGNETLGILDDQPMDTNFDFNFVATNTPGLFDVFTQGTDDYIALDDPSADENFLWFPDEMFGTLDYTNYDPNTGIGNGTFDFGAMGLTGNFNVDGNGNITATSATESSFQTDDMVVDVVPESSSLALLAPTLALLAAGFWIGSRRRKAMKS